MSVGDGIFVGILRGISPSADGAASDFLGGHFHGPLGGLCGSRAHPHPLGTFPLLRERLLGDRKGRPYGENEPGTLVR